MRDSDQLTNSKPCADCLRSLQQSGLFRYCYYSNNNVICRERVDQMVSIHVSNGFRNFAKTNGTAVCN